MNEERGFRDEPWDELIDGKVIIMSPNPGFNHFRVAGNIGVLFANYIDKRRDHTPFIGNFDLYLTEKDRFNPDMILVCDQDKIKADGVHGAPDLVVEVLSPSTAKNDRTYKKDIYAKCGVREYWLVNPADKSVEIYRTDGQTLVFYDLYSVYPDWMLEKMKAEEREAVVTKFKCSLYDGFEISLEDIFSGMLP